MKFRPNRNHLYVEVLPQKVEQSRFLPEELQEKQPFSLVKLLGKPSDSLRETPLGNLLIARTEGLEKFTIDNQEYSIVSEVHIVGEFYEA